jgi:membrane protease YdiL (CAAX protease family)
VGRRWRAENKKEVKVVMQFFIASIRQRPLVTFFVIANALGWAFFALFLVSSQLGFIAFLAPAVAALLTTAAVGGRPHVRALLRTVTVWRINLIWYLVALGLPVLLSFALTLIAIPMGGAAEFRLAPVSILALATFCLAIGEELGWRGYAQPHLETRHSGVVAAILVGILWGFWHLPIFFILAAWLLRRSEQSVLSAALFHGAFNTFTFLTPSLSTNTRWWFIAGTYALTALLVVTLLGRDLTRVHAGSIPPSVRGPTRLANKQTY